MLAIGQLAAEAAFAAMRPDPRRRLRRERAGRRSASGRDRPRTRSSRRGSGRYRLAAGDAAGATSALRKAAERRPARALDRAGPDPRAARAGADDRRRVPRLGAGGVARRSTIARGLGEAAEPEAIHAMTTLAVGHGPGATTRRRPCGCSARRSSGPGRSAWSRSGGGRARTMAVVLELLGRPGEADRRGVPRTWPRRGRWTSTRSTEPARRQRRGHPRRRRPLAGGARAEPPGARLEPGRRPVRERDPQPRRSSRSSPRRARRRAGSSAGSWSSSRPAATSSSRCRPTRRPRRTRCGAATSPTRAGPPSAAGPASGHRGLGADGPHGRDRARGRGGDRRRGAREAADRRRRGVARAGRPDPRRGRGRGRPGARRRRRAAAAASRTRASRPRARSTPGSGPRRSRRPGPSSPGAGAPRRPVPRGAAPAGARPRRSWAARSPGVAARAAGPTPAWSAPTPASRWPRPSSSRCTSTRGRSCASSASSPAAR